MAYEKRLKTIADIRRFLASKILEYDKGKIDSVSIKSFGYALNILAGIIRDSNLEERIEKLELLLEGKTENEN